MPDNLKKKVLFITGTRADFGKLKPLITAVDASDHYDCTVFVTGMHTQTLYGNTAEEVRKCGFSNMHIYHNQLSQQPMDVTLAETLRGIAYFIHENPQDLIVVHGDRVEALAGAISGSLNNIKVAHLDGGEVSGTIDELIRHAVSKLSHVHFVANETASRRLVQMGEREDAVFVIGSPDLDIMISGNLPDIEKAKSYYDIKFDDYAIVLFHPVTTEIDSMPEKARMFVDALIESGNNYVVIYSNNDEGTSFVFH